MPVPYATSGQSCVWQMQPTVPAAAALALLKQSPSSFPQGIPRLAAATWRQAQVNGVWWGLLTSIPSMAGPVSSVASTFYTCSVPSMGLGAAAVGAGASVANASNQAAANAAAQAAAYRAVTSDSGAPAFAHARDVAAVPFFSPPVVVASRRR